MADEINCAEFPEDPACVEECEGEDCPVDDVCEGEDCPAEENAEEEEEMSLPTTVVEMVAWEYAMKFLKMNPFAGNLTYLLVAAGFATKGALKAFSYDKVNEYIYKGGNDKINDGAIWWDIANMINNYADLAIGGIAFIFQLMSMLGVLPMINVLVWFWGVGVVGGIVGLVVTLFYFLAIDKLQITWGTNTGTTADDITKKAFGLGVAPLVQADLAEFLALGAFASLFLYGQGENWMWAQWKALSDEDKEAAVADLREEVQAWEDEMSAKMEKEGEMIEEAEEGEGEEGEEDPAADGEGEAEDPQ